MNTYKLHSCRAVTSFSQEKQSKFNIGDRSLSSKARGIMILQNLTTVFFLLLSLIAVYCQQDVDIYTQNEGTFRNLLLVRDQVIAGSDTKLYRLDAVNLELLETVNITGVNRLLLEINITNHDGDLLACQEESCIFLKSDNLSSEYTVNNPSQQSLASVLIPGTEDLIGLVVMDENFFIARENLDRDSVQITSSISKLGYSTSGSSLQLTLTAKQAENLIFTIRKFLTSFSHNEYVYYLFNLGNASPELRIARICAADEGSGDSIPALTTYTEARLECQGSNSPDSSSATIAEQNGYSILLFSEVQSDINYVCSFNITEVDIMMDEKLDNCANGIGKINLLRDGLSDCPQGLSLEQKQIINGCNRFGSLRPPLEVEDPVTGIQIFSNSSSDKFASLSSVTYEGIIYVYAGHSGAVEQFYLLNDSLIYIRTINIEASDDPVIEIHISEDDESLYILTPNSITKRPVNVCGKLSTCEECVSTIDPLCGWCILSSSCTKLSDCNTKPQIWSTQTAECPGVEDVMPSLIYTHQLDDSSLLSLTLTLFSIPNVSYSCVYNFENSISLTLPAELSLNDTVMCSLPSSSQLPTFDTDTIYANVSLRTQEGVDIIVINSDQQIAFTNCSVQSSCFGCLQSEQKCSWCPLSETCSSPLEDCLNGFNITSTSPSTSCPFISPPDRSDTNDYLIHSQTTQGLSVRANNLGAFDNFNCIIEDKNGYQLFRMRGTWNGSHVNCEDIFFNVSLSATNTILEAVLVIQGNNLTIENPDNVIAIFYSCPLMGDNCGHCLSNDLVFHCGYCSQKNECILLGSSCPDQILVGINDIVGCETPRIESFSPKAGPIRGGTMISIEGVNLGADRSQVESIKIDNVKCDHQEEFYVPGSRLSCITEEITTGILNAPIEIAFSIGQDDNDQFLVTSDDNYQFLIPQLDPRPANPAFGPLSGGTNVTIMGTNLGIGSSRSITLAGETCHILDEESISVDSNITCTTSPGNTTTIRGQGAVTVILDHMTLSALGFDYDNDPTVSGISPTFSFKAGGTNFTITGQDLATVQNPILLIYLSTQQNQETSLRATFDYNNPIRSMSCSVVRDSSMLCAAPSLKELDFANESITVRFGLLMDGVTNLLILDIANLTIFDNPSFNRDSTFSINPGQTSNLTFMGSHFYFTQPQVTVTAGTFTCQVVKITNTTLTCEVEIPSDAKEEAHDIIVSIGNFEVNIGTLQVNGPLNQLVYIVPAFAGLVIIFIVVFIVIFSIFYRKYKQKDQQNDRLLFELERLETSVAHECKLGFAELQTDLDELTGDLAGSRLPYHDFHVYILQSLFPGSKDHPVLHELQLPSHKKAQIERTLKDFHALLLDKTVLLTMIHALESQKGFTIRDKSTMGSLLMLSLHDRLDYATEILKRLLSDLVRRTVEQSYAKLLLRRTESVAEKMLSSWLAFTLHGYVVEHIGQPLYLLFKAVKAQLEKGPIDVITGEARYSLNEQKLIRQQLDIQVINGMVETEDGLQIPVKLLDCDSISQAKEKMLDAVYKNAPVSQRPALASIDIEYRSSKEGVILRDEDGFNDMDYGWRRINTLGHYKVSDRAVFRLIPRQDSPAPGQILDYTGSLMVSHGHRNRMISDAEDGTRVWHLFKQHDEDPRTSPFMSKKMVTEIYLPRMLSTKTILQTFVDELFNGIFTLSHPPISPSHLYTPMTTMFPQATAAQLSYAPGSDSLPIAIKYIFDFLDDEAQGAKITDADTIHTWKNNSLALRFWVNLIKNPEFVFDINKSAIVDSCLSVIAQAFIDGCSSSSTRPTINSPTSKLLYNKEVQGYKSYVKSYYEEISELPRVPEDMMMHYLKNLSSHHVQQLKKSHDFHTESALYEIMRYIIKYRETILDALRTAGLDSKAQILDTIIHCTM